MELLEGLAALESVLLPVMFISIRLGALFMLAPALGSGLPVTVRVLIVLGLSVALSLGLPATLLPITQTGSAALVAAVASEFALGATLALGVLAAFASIAFAGRLIDIQIGFGMAQVFDPVTQRQSPVITSAFSQAAILAFLLTESHHALMRAVAFSMESFPPGKAWLIEAAFPMVIQQMTALFSLGFALAAPVVVCLLLVDLCAGAIARNLPQINIFVIAMPAKVLTGLAVLSVWLSGAGAAMNRIYGALFREWQDAFAAMGAR